MRHNTVRLAGGKRFGSPWFPPLTVFERAVAVVTAVFSNDVLVFGVLIIAQLLQPTCYSCVRVRVCVAIPFILDVRHVDAPAGVTQEEGHTGFFLHLTSAVLALSFIVRRIQPPLSLVDREVEFSVPTNKSFSACWACFLFLLLFFVVFLVRKNSSSCDCTEVRTHVPTPEGLGYQLNHRGATDTQFFSTSGRCTFEFCDMQCSICFGDRE